jgi:hypothetical protein
MAANGTPVQNSKDDEAEKVVYAVMDSMKDYGNFYLLKSISERIGLIKCLSEAMPDCWQKVFTLACYLVSTGKPIIFLHS